MVISVGAAAASGFAAAAKEKAAVEGKGEKGQETA